MKKILSLFFILFTATFTVNAQNSAVEKVAKSVFTLTTFKADGSILATCHGAFIDNKGTAISEWSPFIGADHAVVIDAEGKKMDVDCLVSANELYDIAKFCVKGNTTPAIVASSPSTVGSSTWLVSYSLKKTDISNVNISKVETFMNKYPYYILSQKTPENTDGCPIVNANGQIIGLLQRSKTDDAVNATSALFASDFKCTGLSMSDPVMRQSSICVALPDNKEQAVIALMLASQYSKDKYNSIINNFIEKFPQLPDGYKTRAQIEVNDGKFDDAVKDMETSIKLSEKKDEAHYDYARIIYQKELYMVDKPYSAWNLDKAMNEAEQAYSINPQPIYKHLQAQITYSKKDYQQAYDMFMNLTKTSLRNPELYYEAAQCKQMLKASDKEVIALLDSAVNVCKQPMTIEGAPYLLARAVAYENNGEYRKAVIDYTNYEKLSQGQLNADFYFQREQCEIKAKIYQQALNDMDKAIALSPAEPTYYAEKASTLLRVNMVDESIATANKCISIAPQYSDGYLIKGLAQIQKGNKKEGLDTLAKAKEYGNPQAQTLIDKYSK